MTEDHNAEVCRGEYSPKLGRRVTVYGCDCGTLTRHTVSVQKPSDATAARWSSLASEQSADGDGQPFSSYLSRLCEWYRDVATPDHVEKAPRREVWKRQAWMIGSLTICLLGAYAVNNAIVAVFDPEPSWFLVGVLAAPVIAAIYVDIKYVFPWGMDRFDLVPPWQFRDEEAKADD